MFFVIGLITGLVVATVATTLYFRAQMKARATRDLELARKIREEEQAALMGTIASGLAHEIRNPLSTLSLNLQLLQEDWQNPITDREQKSARKVESLLREIHRLERILNDFLRFAAGHKLKLERVDLKHLVDEVVDFTAPQAEKSQIRIKRDYQPCPPVQADPNILRQALLNLILNAYQAMPTGGELIVHTRPGNGSCSVMVQDTGIGIPPENMDKIFNLYFSTKPAGTGLGLPMARKIIEEHGGTMTVESVVGKGTTFTITVPTLDAQAVPADDRSPE